MMPMIAAAGSSGRSYSKPKAARPAATAARVKRQKGGTDHALKAAAAVYGSLGAADAALDVQMRAATSKAENDRLEREGDRICERRSGVVRKAIRLPAVTLSGAAAKADMLAAEIVAAKGMELSTDSAVLKLAASLAADVRRTAAPTLAGLLAAEDASADAEMIQMAADWSALQAAYNAEPGDEGPAADAFLAMVDRFSELQPTTLAGMLAKARVAKLEALLPDGTYKAEGTYAMDMGWDLSNALLRLVGEDV